MQNAHPLAVERETPMNTRRILTNAAITGALVAVPLVAVVGTASADPIHDGGDAGQWHDQGHEGHDGGRWDQLLDQQNQWPAPFVTDPGAYTLPNLNDLFPQPAPVSPLAGIFTGSAG